MISKVARGVPEQNKQIKKHKQTNKRLVVKRTKL